MDTGSLAWSREYPREMPACWPADDERLILGWNLNSDAAKAELKSHSPLQKEAEALKDKKHGLLLETVAPETGAILEQLVIPETDLSHGLNDQRRATISGEFALVRGEDGNTVIYRMGDGSKVGEFFGQTLATEAGAGLVAASNRENEILLVEECTGAEIRRFTFGSPVREARIVKTHGDQKGETLLVLTADQVVHRISVEKEMSSAR